MMDCFLQFKKHTEKQLKRKLNDREVVFLQWLWQRYTEEDRRVNV